VRVVSSGRERRILDFDIENRPLSYWYDGNPTAEVTAIAWSWVGDDNIRVVTLTTESSPGDLLEEFLPDFRKADMVTGHYIRRHDLPILNGALFEEGMDPLPSIRTEDTKLDLLRYSGIPATQEFLGAVLGVEAPKVNMTQVDWRQANRLGPKGIERTVERVCGDVLQHKLIRAELLDRGLLKPPSMWYTVPGGIISQEA
jgi:hypothetical protein